MSSFKLKPATATDSYKIFHADGYTPGTQFIYSNLTPRSDKIFMRGISKEVAKFYDGKLIVMGIQGAVKELHYLWHEEFFSKPKAEVCDAYATRVAPYVGGLTVSTARFEELHDYGSLPIEVMAIQEGNHVNMGVPILTVVNTDPRFYWVTNYLETYLSAQIWKPCTTATIAGVYRNILKHYAKLTGSPLSFVNWQGHDFSNRGMSGMEDAARSGMGHLVSFTGTDTIQANEYADYAYRGAETFVSGSVPATEHSVMTLDGIDGEFELFKRIITESVPTGIVSLVADGFDYWKVLTEFLPALKDDILARKPDALGFAKVVIRPDSGDPVDIVCGTVQDRFETLDEAIKKINSRHTDQANEDCEGSHCMGLDSYSTVVQVGAKYFELTTPFEYNRHDKTYYYIDNWSQGAGTTTAKLIDATPEMKGSIEVLWDTFGGTTTETGHKLLDSHIGLIYGDSITLDRAHQILDILAKKGFASANVVFGIGSYTYQVISRDTFGMAMKATWAMVNGEPRNIFKDPKTGDGLKKSAKGLLRVFKEGNDYHLLDQQENVTLSELACIYSEGFTGEPDSLSEIRLRSDPEFTLG